MSEVRAHDWVEERIHELHQDAEYQAKVEQIREGVAKGTFVGERTSRADLERLAESI